jgi:hypothetical protein
MAVNKLTLETDGLVVGATQLVASGGGVTIGQNLAVGGGVFTANFSASGPVSIAGNLVISNTASSTSTTTGAFVVAGGVGVAGNLFLGGQLNITRSTNGDAFLVNSPGGSTPNFTVQGSGEQTFRLYNSAATGSTRTSIKLASRNNTDWEYIAYTDAAGTGINDLTIANQAGTALYIANTRAVSVYNYANINISSGSLDSALQIYGNVSRGGAGYHDFLRVTSTASGATNPNKYFRLNSTGNLEIINSAYSSAIMVLTDSGILVDVKGDVRASPINSQPGSYVAVATDAGKTIVESLSAAQITFNASVFASGDMISVINTSAGTITLVQGTSVTLRLAGTATTGTRTLASNGLATVICTVGGSAPIFFCSGAGLT